MENQNEVLETATLFADGEEVVTIEVDSGETINLENIETIEIVEEPVQLTIDDFTDVDSEETEETNVDEIPDPANYVEGKVINASRLRVRKEPSTTADIITELDKDTTIMIDLNESTEEFYKVYTLEFEGYCVKTFIEIQ